MQHFIRPLTLGSSLLVAVPALAQPTRGTSDLGQILGQAASPVPSRDSTASGSSDTDTVAAPAKKTPAASSAADASDATRADSALPAASSPDSSAGGEPAGDPPVPPAPSPTSELLARQAEARQLMEDGVEADAAGEKERAAELFAASLALHPSYDVAGNLGLVEFHLERYADAANHLAYCLHHFASGQKRELRNLIEQKFAVAQDYVGEVDIQVSESHAEVLVDGEVIGTSPLALGYYVVEGTHEISARSGERQVQQTVVSQRGQTESVKLELPAPEALVAQAAYANVHQTKLPWWPAAISGGLALGSFGASMVLRGLASSDRDELAELRGQLGPSGCSGGNAPSECNEMESLATRYGKEATAADVTLVASGALAALTIGYLTYVFIRNRQIESKSEQARRDRLSASEPVFLPVFDGRQFGFTVRAAF